MRTAPMVYPLERFLRRISGGRKGILDLAGLPSVRITVAGRKTGIPRTTSLLYVPYRGNILVVGSNWGSRQHPVWSANLRAAPSATVWRAGEEFEVTVTELADDERARAWQAAVDFWPGYRMEAELSGGRRFRVFELVRK
ncbi:nitroreductase/quinone reductase family protein [Nocardia callitridis]|uniref:Nitroreductase/quinone reductase family protein n=2 Tax=Nocardia callitridis TaxID=648753 RepID=A0ABP9K262_9NOCA